MHVRCLLFLLLASGAWATPASADTYSGVHVLSCSGGDDSSAGTVTYVARMRAVPHAARMALRIRLLERFGDEAFHRVSVPDLGVWRTSDRWASAFQWTQRVRGLRTGGVYRAVVRYRWFAADGTLIRSARTRSHACRQRGGLPNLRVAAIDVTAGDVKDTAVYHVHVVNRGTSQAKHVGVLLRVDGEVVDSAVVISTLDPGETRTVTFDGPVCRKQMRAVVDPKELIPETREQDNTRAPACV